MHERWCIFSRVFANTIPGTFPVPFPAALPGCQANVLTSLYVRGQATENGVHQQCTGRWLWLLQVQGAVGPVSSTADWLVRFASQV